MSTVATMSAAEIRDLIRSKEAELAKVLVDTQANACRLRPQLAALQQQAIALNERLQEAKRLRHAAIERFNSLGNAVYNASSWVQAGLVGTQPELRKKIKVLETEINQVGGALRDCRTKLEKESHAPVTPTAALLEIDPARGRQQLEIDNERQLLTERRLALQGAIDELRTRLVESEAEETRQRAAELRPEVQRRLSTMRRGLKEVLAAEEEHRMWLATLAPTLAAMLPYIAMPVPTRQRLTCMAEALDTVLK